MNFTTHAPSAMNIELNHISGGSLNKPIIFDIEVVELSTGYQIARRLLDIVVACLALILTLPITLMVGLIIRVTSPGGVLFKQTRVGRGGKHFTCYKLRSMVCNAEEIRVKTLHLDETTDFIVKPENDPRITPIGKFIRKSSIDELPQLWNVLRGEMTLVGPRPPIPFEVDRYSTHHLKRLAVKPGLTCLWQISGRSNIDFDRWVEMDVEYIQNMNFWFDLVILFKTIPAVISARGAR